MMLTFDEAREAFSYDPETGVLLWRNTGRRAGCNASKHNPYPRVRINGRVYGVHRVAWVYMFQVLPVGEIDHINGDKTDNRIDNLRAVFRSENIVNGPLRKDNKAGLKGVSYQKSKRKWVAQISIHGKRHFLGRFRTAELAKIAYDEASILMHGDFRREL